MQEKISSTTHLSSFGFFWPLTFISFTNCNFALATNEEAIAKKHSPGIVGIDRQTAKAFFGRFAIRAL